LVRRLLASDADVDRVENEANSAKEAGIDGVPCFIVGGSLIVTGAQSPEYLANAIQRIAGQHTRLRRKARAGSPACPFTRPHEL
jgi:predicted DsbA family dithiol-disulfide isomerase